MLIDQKEFDFFTNKIVENQDKIKEYALNLKESKNYKNFETRLAFDVLNFVYKTSGVCDLYEKYNVDDSHLQRFSISCLKKAGIL